MTDTPNPARRSRTRSYREPPVIDGTATEIAPGPGSGTNAETEAAPDATAPGSPEKPAVEAARVGSEDMPPSGVIEPKPSDEAPAQEPLPDAAPADDSRRGAGTVPPVAAASEPVPTAKAPARGRTENYVLAGLLGGLAGAGLIVLANNYFQPPTGRLESRIAQLEERASAPQGAPTQGTAATQALERRLAAVETEARALGDRVRQAAELAQRGVTRAEEALGRPAPQPPAAGTAAPASPQVPTEVTGRIEALERRIAEQGASAAQPVQALEQRVAEQVQARQQAVQTLEQRLGALEARTTQASQAVGQQAQGLERRLADQDAKLDGLAKRLAELSPAALTAGLRAVAADRLNDLLREGAPYKEALAALGGLQADPATLRLLEPFAASGAPTGRALAGEFRAVADRILAETRPASEGVGDRLWRMADNIVTVRPVGDAASTDPRSLVARIEEALAAGDYARAAQAFDALPEPGRRAAAPFGERLKQRAAAEGAARAVSSAALSALEASTR